MHFLECRENPIGKKSDQSLEIILYGAQALFPACNYSNRDAFEYVLRRKSFQLYEKAVEWGRVRKRFVQVRFDVSEGRKAAKRRSMGSKETFQGQWFEIANCCNNQ